MARYGWSFAVVLGALVWAAPSGAWACEAHDAVKAEDAKAQEAKPVTPGEHRAAKAAAQDEVQLADKCDCSGPSDCTCKKGKCKCKNCEKKRSVTDPMKGQKDALRLPDKATKNASAGAFI